jgi:hypothetical protein
MPECFVIMPFRPELHYMYLYLKHHIETTFPDTVCQRGDDEILTVPLLDKINSLIQRADVVVADCTGRNPNVFYELGIAHALEKPVVLITQDEIEEAPTDIRAFEFIKYELGPHTAFVANLDRALSKYLQKDFVDLFRWAAPYVDEFSDAVRAVERNSEEEFSAAVAARVPRTGVPSDESARARLLMPLLIRNANDLDIALALNGWIEEKFGKP